jgi:hypothetical protein
MSSTVLLVFQWAGQQARNGALKRYRAGKQVRNGANNREFDTAGTFEDGWSRGDAFHHGSGLRNQIRQGNAAAESKPEAKIAARCARAGENQVAKPREPGHGIRAALVTRGRFRRAPRR